MDKVQDERLMSSLTNAHKEDRFIRRLINRPGDGSGYALEALNFSQYMAITAKRTAERYAVSYRQFYVGAVALGATPNFSHLIFIHGMNVKSDEAGAVNFHAEDIVIAKARRYGAQIMSLMVTGEPRIDPDSGLDCPTLHPCGRCRQMLDTAQDVMLPTTTIFSAAPDFKDYEMYGLPALRRLHETRDYSTPGIWRFQVEEPDQWTDITLPLFFERLAELGVV